MVVRDIITAALRVLGVIASGETPAGQESVDALFSLNRILESMSSDVAYLYKNESASYVLPAPASEVTFGPAASLVLPIDSVIDAVSVNNVAFSVTGPMGLIAQAARAVQVRYSSPTSKFVFAQAQPVGALVVVYYRPPLDTYASLDDEVTLPKGYANMLIYELAADLAPGYGVTMSPDAFENRRKYTTTVKRTNSNSQADVVDTRADVASTTTGFDIYAGT